MLTVINSSNPGSLLIQDLQEFCPVFKRNSGILWFVGQYPIYVVQLIQGELVEHFQGSNSMLTSIEFYFLLICCFSPFHHFERPLRVLGHSILLDESRINTNNQGMLDLISKEPFAITTYVVQFQHCRIMELSLQRSRDNLRSCVSHT